MLYGLEDVGKLKSLLRQSAAPERQRRIEAQKLDALLGYCETTRCRREVLLGYFGEPFEGPCGRCDNCLERPESFDGTELAQKALSAVYRTGQRFGAGHLIDVLRGVENERARALGHDRLSVFGVGRDLPPQAWRSVLRQLAALGLLEVDVEGHGGMHLGEECRAVLRGERQVLLRRDPTPTKPARTRAERTAPAPVPPPTSCSSRRCAAGGSRWRAHKESRPTSSFTTPRSPPSRRRGRRASGRWPRSRAWGPPSSSATATRSSTWWRRRADG